MSAPVRSNSASASGPLLAISVLKPSRRSRKASGSAIDSSSSTIKTLVMSSSVVRSRACADSRPRRRRASTAGLVDGREPQGEGRAGARAGSTRSPAAVVGRDVLDDGQPEAGTAGRPGAGRVDPEEPLEHPLWYSGAMPTPRSVTAIATMAVAQRPATDTWVPAGE